MTATPGPPPVVSSFMAAHGQLPQVLYPVPPDRDTDPVMLIEVAKRGGGDLDKPHVGAWIVEVSLDGELVFSADDFVTRQRRTHYFVATLAADYLAHLGWGAGTPGQRAKWAPHTDRLATFSQPYSEFQELPLPPLSPNLGSVYSDGMENIEGYATDMTNIYLNAEGFHLGHIGDVYWLNEAVVYELTAVFVDDDMNLYWMHDSGRYDEQDNVPGAGLQLHDLATGTLEQLREHFDDQLNWTGEVAARTQVADIYEGIGV